VIAGAITLLVISSVIFLISGCCRGSRTRHRRRNGHERDVALLRTRLNRISPFTVQYGIFLGDLAHGNLGTSARTQLPVVEEVFARLPRTHSPRDGQHAHRHASGRAGGPRRRLPRYSIFDLLVSFGTLCGVSMPVYWLGLMLIVLFAVKLGWLPAAGADSLASVILPGSPWRCIPLA